MIDFKNYERLSDKEFVKKLQEHYYGDHDKRDITYLRLAELEDMIEQGKLVEKIEPKTAMTKEQQIKEMVEILQNSTTKSAEYFQSEVKKAFTNGSKSIKRSDCDKSIYDISAEDLYNAGYRKQEEIEKQVAKEILEEFWKIQYGQSELDNVCIRLAEKYGLLKELQGE